MFVRPVEIDKVATQRLQNGEGAGRAIDELLIAAPEETFYHEGVSLAGFEAAVFEEGIDEVEVRGQFENSLDRAERLPGADEIVIRPFSEDKFQGTDDHGFAGTGLTGDPDEAGTELPGEIIHEGEVLDF